ncbi:NAD(P)/FAD-dependent oxidoreductase [Halorussus gelatinilyticus]|uniref:NAD(P)/FAD-dependent oxidoreductase n=1 Tax=Halorussus gelatinilyticus TaxID=2937524 RepID=A0A8U0IP45_9EURY|nr:NAD(P)/FAD-dependent oxidoreductase [Halorussus gelatinilyticus]UPW02242.1 NAD(P)/FAD-dependent oxidoreductase [Halorussus gelatinilyticus]
MSDRGTDDRDGPGEGRPGESDAPADESDDRAGATGDPDRYDVAVVGGGPAGCSAAVFAARYGLDAVLFDRGRSSIRQCAYLENYLGFPAGVGIETFYELMHDHVTTAGCELVADLVASVTREGDGERFVVETEGDRRVSATRVVAATRYDGDYLRALGDGTLLESAAVEGDDAEESDDEARERLDRSAIDSDGTTPIDGLYVASPSDEADRQAVVAAGRGARVGLAVVRDARRAAGYPEPVADHYDWVRREAARDDEWADRNRWREYYDGRRPEDADVDDARWETLRERDIDRRFGTYLSDDEIAARTERGQRRLLDHIDDELVVERAREIESDPVEASR